jgi:iron complex outermembrane receptor protein
MNLSARRAWLVCSTAVAVAGFGFDARAQTIASGGSRAASAAAPAPQDEVHEVVVTARHRDEALQTVPISIAVVSGAAALAKNLNDIGDISAQVPSVDFRTGASNKDRTVFIRGAGTISTSPGVEPSVSTVVDGVVMARPGQATVDLLDLDHIEVLRGPQGTLFGKNASAGVINIVTKSPTSTPTASVDAGYYEGNEYRVGATIAGPITDKLKGLLSVFTGHYDGNVTNLYTKETVNGYEHTGARGKLVYTPTSALTLTFAADYTHSVDTVPTGVFKSASQVAYPTNVVTTSAPLAAELSSQGITPSSDNRTVSQNVSSSVHDKNGGASMQADWDVGGGYTLTSITAYRLWENHQFQDYDQLSAYNASLPQVQDLGQVEFHQTSEELRIASPKGRFIDFVAGAFYLGADDRERYERDVTRLVAGAPANDFGVNYYGASDDNYAVFGEANVNFTSNFRLIVGGREIWDDLSYYTNRVSTATLTHSVTGVQPSFADSGSSTRNGVAGRVGLQYDIAPSITTYVTYSHGYKGPAYNVFFNMALSNTGLLKPETSNSYEVGLKSQFFEHRLQVDLAGFITDFDNYQANSTQIISGALVTNLVNAGSVTSRGVEADIIAKPIRALTLNFNGAYDDAHVVDFPCPTGAAITCNINGEPLPFAPKWKMHVEGDYRIPITAKFDLDFDTDYNWQTKTQYQLSETPDTIQPAYGIWNGSIGLIDAPDGWNLRFLIKNIADQHYSSYLSHGDLAGVVRWVPRDDDRYVGFNVHKDF